MSRILIKKNDAEHLAEIASSNFFYQQSLCGFISFLPDGTILRVNQTFCKWLGLTEGDIYGLKFSSLLSKEDALYYRMGISTLLKLQGFVDEINFNFVSAKGHFDTLFNAVSYEDESGQLIAINATIQKITKRKKFENDLLKAKSDAIEEKRRFEFLSNTVPNLIWTALPNGKINFINQRYKDYFGYSDAEEVHNAKDIFIEDRQGMRNACLKCLISGRKMEKEIRLQAEGKNPEWFFVSAQPFYNENGNIELWFGSFTSIHKQKLLQQANYSSLTSSLNLANKTIDNNKQKFMKIAMDQSHMIRKPLANILGLLSLLDGIPLTSEAKDMISLLNISAAELDGLIKEVVANAGTID